MGWELPAAPPGWQGMQSTERYRRCAEEAEAAARHAALQCERDALLKAARQWRHLADRRGARPQDDGVQLPPGAQP